MKLIAGLTAALLGCAAAHSADVYILQQHRGHESAASPSIPRQLARLILLQRLFPDTRTGSLNYLPETISRDDGISYINDFGVAPRTLFAKDTVDTKQLVVFLEGVTSDNTAALADAMPGLKPAFVVDDVPSSAANRALVEVELGHLDVSATCTIAGALNPADRCAGRGSRVVKYDIEQNPDVLRELRAALPQLRRHAELSEMETVLVLLPASSRESLVSWSGGGPASLRARQAAEEVMTEAIGTIPTAATDSSSSSTPGAPFRPAASVDFSTLPACFQSAATCMSTTANCSGHGGCENVYSRRDGTPLDGPPCFACVCKSTQRPSGLHDHWAGAACQKIDVSVPFWLFTGFTVALVGILSFAVGMLFSVGEETLPGVIGAGVSKPK